MLFCAALGEMICLGDVYPMSGDWEIPTTKIEGRRRLS
jgi:hypothetical protein